MKEVCLSLGSNHGNRRQNVEEALEWIKGFLIESRCSTVYETKAVHGFGPAYFNAVVCGYSSCEYDCFNRKLKEYEIKCGRTREARTRNEVIIDLDVVIWNKEIIRPIDFSRDFFQIGYKEITEKTFS